MAMGDSVLENKLRRMIYNHILRYPGVSYNTLKEIFELTDSSLRYHIYYLEKNNKITSGMENNNRCFYAHPASVSILLKSQQSVESQKLTLDQERILDIIMHNPGIHQKELVARTRMNRFKVMRNLNTLKNLNLIKNSKDQNMVCYEYIPDVEMKFRIIKGLMVKFLKNEIDEATFLKLKRRLDE